MTNSLHQVVTSGYDANGNLTNLVDGGATSAVAYDAMNRETSAYCGHGITANYAFKNEADWSTVEGPTLGHMECQTDV